MPPAGRSKGDHTMSFVRYEQKEQYAVATIDREKALNALNSQVLEDLNTMLDGINFDEVRALIITGAGQKSFVAGAEDVYKRQAPG